MNSKIMKVLIFIILAQAFFCFAPHFLPTEPFEIQTHYYEMSEFFDSEERRTIEMAVQHFEDNVKCVEFVNAEYVQEEKINDSRILHIVPAEVVSHDRIGQYSQSKHEITLGRNSLRRQFGTDKYIMFELNEIFKFKIMLHELAHSLGMPANPHPMPNSKASHLSANIGHGSSKFLYKNDILYLNKMICNK